MAPLVYPLASFAPLTAAVLLLDHVRAGCGRELSAKVYILVACLGVLSHLVLDWI